uniref:Uncharacterized protein n=1 Tax=Anopheles coluzzii TaxID=1518534 RepID=A0A8W7PKL6_ANOCL
MAVCLKSLPTIIIIIIIIIVNFIINIIIFIIHRHPNKYRRQSSLPYSMLPAWVARRPVVTGCHGGRNYRCPSWRQPGSAISIMAISSLMLWIQEGGKRVVAAGKVGCYGV